MLTDNPAFRHVCVLTGDPRLPDATKRNARYNEEDLVTHAAMRDALTSLTTFSFEFFDDHARLWQRISDDPPEFVLNFCDTGFRNVATHELHVPALFELAAVRYSGAPPACIALCYDKQIVRLVAESLGIAVPREHLLAADRTVDDLPDLYPAIIKPNRADGSVGITKDAVVHDREQARCYLTWLRETLPGRDALLQEYLPGDEYGIGLIGNPATELAMLPPLVVDYSGLPRGLAPILSYESKAIPTSPYWTDIRFQPAELSEDVQARLGRAAARLFARLGCRDYARFDFRTAADGTIKLMEVNPNPAWANDGKLALMAGFAGKTYPQMLEMILHAASARLAAERATR